MLKKNCNAIQCAYSSQDFLNHGNSLAVINMLHRPGVVVHAFNPSTQEAEAEAEAEAKAKADGVMIVLSL